MIPLIFAVHWQLQVSLNGISIIGATKADHNNPSDI